MKIEVENLTGHYKKINIEVPTERVDHHVNGYYSELAKEATLNGFRKGKAPLHLIKQTYAESSQGRIIQEIVEATLNEALREHSFEPVDMPEINVEGLREGSPFKYSAKFENTPPVNLKKYNDFSEKKPSVEVTDEDVSKAFENIRTQMARHEKAPEGSTATKGLFARLDFEARENGEIFAPATEKDVFVELGSGALFEQFETNIAGMKAGETKKFKVTFPMPEKAEERLPVSGKTLDFEVALNELNTRVLPEPSDAWAAQLGPFKTLLELKARIREDIKNQKETNVKRELQEKGIGWLIDNNPVDVPETMFNRQMEQLAMDAGVQLSQMGLDEKSIEDRLKSWGDEMSKTATRQVKASLLLGAIAKKENIQASEQDIREEIVRIAMQSRRNPAEVADDLKKRGLIGGLLRQVTELKALDWVIRNSLS